MRSTHHVLSDAAASDSAVSDANARDAAVSGAAVSGAAVPDTAAPKAVWNDDLRVVMLSLPLVVGALLWLYYPTLTQLILSWRTDEYYAHGPLLPLVTIYLIWRQQSQLKESWLNRPRVPRWPLLLIAGLGLQLIGMIADVNFLRAFSIPIVLLGLARFIGGAEFERQLRLPFAYLALSVPLSRVIAQTFSVPLQNIGAGFASMVLGLLGFSIESEGVNIYTPGYNFVVDVPCSGLKTTIALLTVAVLVAHLLPGLSKPQRAVLVLLSVPIALVTNALRIIIIVLLGINFGYKVAEGFLHDFSNVFTFGLSMAMLMGVGSLMRRSRTAEAMVHEGTSEQEPSEQESSDAMSHRGSRSTPQLNKTEPTSEPKSTRPKLQPGKATIKSNGARLVWKTQLTIIILLVLTQFVGTHAIATSNEPVTTASIQALRLPERIGAWAGQPVKVSAAVYELLRPDAAVQKRYTLTTATDRNESTPPPQVDVIVVYSRDPRGFHAPEVCLKAAGWTISNRETRQARNGSESLALTVVTGESKRGQTHLAYFFGDTGQQATGWIPMLAKEAAGRVLRRRTGAVEVQFAYDPRLVLPNGEFSPLLSNLMLSIAQDVRHELASAQPA